VWSRIDLTTFWILALEERVNQRNRNLAKEVSTCRPSPKNYHIPVIGCLATAENHILFARGSLLLTASILIRNRIGQNKCAAYCCESLQYSSILIRQVVFCYSCSLGKGVLVHLEESQPVQFHRRRNADHVPHLRKQHSGILYTTFASNLQPYLESGCVDSKKSLLEYPTNVSLRRCATWRNKYINFIVDVAAVLLLLAILNSLPSLCCHVIYPEGSATNVAVVMHQVGSQGPL